MRRMASRMHIGDGVVITSEGKTCERGGRQLLHSRRGNTKGLISTGQKPLFFESVRFPGVRDAAAHYIRLLEPVFREGHAVDVSHFHIDYPTIFIFHLQSGSLSLSFLGVNLSLNGLEDWQGATFVILKS
jgi:hypothetical protein